MNKEVLNIIKSFGFNDVFPRQVINEADRVSRMPINPDKFTTEGRVHLESLLTITIDGEDAKDLDDAISIEKIDEGYKLFVHIADVSHYVRNHYALDYFVCRNRAYHLDIFNPRRAYQSPGSRPRQRELVPCRQRKAENVRVAAAD